jgi:hypothetical protein
MLTERNAAAKAAANRRVRIESDSVFFFAALLLMILFPHPLLIIKSLLILPEEQTVLPQEHFSHAEVRLIFESISKGRISLREQTAQ